MRGNLHVLSYCRMKQCFNGIYQYRRQCKHTASELAKKKGWESVIGLEIHAQIQAKSKLFSGSGALYGQPVNSQVAFMDCALPGTLPVLNQRCVEAGLITALALDCKINKVSYFDRKHYFYADMPSGYQITQQRQALAQHGKVTYLVNGQPQVATILQIQLEQDSGKSFHDADSGISLIDLNRAGIGLMEIVTNPDFRAANEARAFVKELQLIITLLGTCRCIMAEGKLRVDASISLHRPGEPLGTRCEVKNLNSLGFLEKAIEYEIKRQLDIIEGGGTIENETRNYISEEGITVVMRDKEKVHDYRFMPEPNLFPLRLYDNDDMPDTVDQTQQINIDTVRDNLPMLPMARRNKLITEFQLSMLHANQIVHTQGYWELFHKLCGGTGRRPKFVTAILLQELAESLKLLESNDSETSDIGINIRQLEDIIDMLEDRKIARIHALSLLKECVLNNQLNVREAVDERDLILSHDIEEITKYVSEVIQDNQTLVNKVKKTKSMDVLIRKLVSMVLKTANYKYDAKLVTEAVTAQLS